MLLDVRYSPRDREVSAWALRTSDPYLSAADHEPIPHDQLDVASRRRQTGDRESAITASRRTPKVHPPDEMSRTQRKPMFVVVLSGVFDVRAATLYRLQYE